MRHSHLPWAAGRVSARAPTPSSPAVPAYLPPGRKKQRQGMYELEQQALKAPFPPATLPPSLATSLTSQDTATDATLGEPGVDRAYTPTELAYMHGLMQAQNPTPTIDSSLEHNVTAS